MLSLDSRKTYRRYTYIFCQSQQILGLRLGEEKETVEVGDDDHHVQYDVTTDNTIAAQYLNSRLVDHLHWIHLYEQIVR